MKNNFFVWIALFVVSCVCHGYAIVTTNLPTTATGGVGSIANVLTNDTTYYSAARNDTISIGGFTKLGGTITSVVLHVEFSVESGGYTGNKYILVNGVSTGIQPVSGDTSRTVSLDITAGAFGIDTWTKVETLQVTFNNNDGNPGQDVMFDYAYLVITHAPPPPPDPMAPTWSDEFNSSGAPDTSVWSFEIGENIRNNELQYYTTNAWQEGGNLIIEGRRENMGTKAYTSASIKSDGKFYWQYGRAQIRAKVSNLAGLWPAIWGCGQTGEWPSNGEVDIMENYGNKILANCARGTTNRWTAAWDSANRTVNTSLTTVDPSWTNSFHIWTMQWDQQNVRLYVDNILLNTISQTWLTNAVTTWGPQYPFKQPFTIWLNLAIGGNAGGDPSGTPFPQRYYVDYWRIWEGATNNVGPTDIAISTNSVSEGLPAGTVVGYLSATDADPAEVIRYTLVVGTGDTNNSQFVIPEFLSDNTKECVLKTASVLSYSGGATRSIRVRATDIEGATYDKVLTINVLPSGDTPAITLQPSSQSVSAGTMVTFSVTATGSNLAYQWQKDGVSLANAGHYSGVTSDTLTIIFAEAGDAADYRCVVTNSSGSVTSSVATLTVSANPALTAPDLTSTNPPSIDTSLNYNLGPTGMRGWIYVDRSANAYGVSRGVDGTMTDSKPYQVLVTSVGTNTPASTLFQVNDVLLGVNTGFNNVPVPLFTNDTRRAIGTAIGTAEAGDGWMNFRVWRSGLLTNLSLRLSITNTAYSASAPYNCPKSALVLSNAVNVLAGQPFNYGTPGNSMVGLAMLASGRTNLLPAVQACARSIISDPQTHAFWDWGYKGIFLSEYYLRTGDTNVLPVIHAILLNIANGTDRYGTACHGPGFLNMDGSYNGTAGGYGPVNNCALTATIAMTMGRKCLEAAGRSVDPAIPAAITRGSNFFGWHLQKGEIQYGEHLPWGSGTHASNGKHGQATIFFAMLGDRPVDTEYWSRMTLAGYMAREYGHTGQGISYLWESLGANVAGTNAMASYMANIRWHLDLERRADGSFVYDGAEQYGPSQVNDYWIRGGANTYAGEDPTASYVLTYALPLQQIYITGKNANPTNFLSAASVSNAIWSALIPTNSVVMTTNQLMAALGEFDPNVRCWSALELGKRPGVSVSSITNLIGSTNAWLRASACVVLGQMQNTNGFPALVQCLSDPDVSVRAHAAIALKKCGSAISGYIPSMLTAYINNATDPNVINWNDPWQGANETLGEVLFGGWILTSGVGNDNLVPHTANASRSLLYPALKIALKHPDSLSRAAAASFIKNYLTLADVQALALDLVQCATTPVLADPMWRMEGRVNSIQALAKFNCAETVPVALAMINPPWVALGRGDGPENESPNAAINAIAGFGDAVRYVLPTFHNYRADWGASDGRFWTLAAAINTISSAITCPVITNVFPVAHSKVVVTTNAIAITLTGSSCRTNVVSFQNVTAPLHGILTGTAPNLTYTPTPGYTGLDRFTFRVADSMTNSDPATVSIFVGTAAGAGIQGQYYDNPDFTSNTFTRTDTQINFDWATGSPSNSIASDTFSVRWSGGLLVPESGTYMFSTLASDGVRLYINGINVIDDWATQNSHWTDGASVYLTAGQKYEVRMDYFEGSGNAAAKLKWTGPSFAGLNGGIIASQWLYTTNALTNLPLYAYAQHVTMLKNTNQVIGLTGSPAATNFWISSGPSHGSLSGTPPSVTYTPTANYSGADSFAFQASDGSRTSAVATITLNILENLPAIFDWSNAADGNWSVAGNWTNTVAPDAAGQPYYTLNFGKSGTYTVNNDLNAGFKANQINFAGNVTVTGNGICTTNNGTNLPQINQNSGEGIALNAPLRLDAITTVGGLGAGSITLNGQLTGPGGLAVNIPGNLRVENVNNNYSGGTLINDGTLIMGYQVDRALGTGPVILNRATLYLERINATNALTVNGGKLWAEGGWGGSWNGPVTLNGDLTLYCPGYDRFFINGGISGVGGVIVSGDGYGLPSSGNGILFSGTNTYAGATTIKARGRLACSSPTALGNGVLSIDSGSILELNYAGTRTNSWLTLDGVDKPAGVYGSTSSPAPNKDSHFAGTGTVTISPIMGSITNQPASAIAADTATLNAQLTGNGAPYTVLAYWNVSNGGTNAPAWTNSALIGSWTIQGSTNISCAVTGLVSNTKYYFTFCATNTIQKLWATNVLSFVTSTVNANAYLANLEASAGTLTPSFDVFTTNYTDTVNYAISSLTLTPTAADTNATIKVNGSVVASGMPSLAFALSVGATNIKTVVVSKDLSTTNTYSVLVTRMPASTNALLASLVPSVGSMTPAFAGNTLSYAMTVPYATSNMTLTPTAAEASATIMVNGVGVTSGASSGSIALNVGNTIITTVVTAQNGVTTKTYTVTVTRSPATLTITPQASQTKIFGALDPTLLFSYSGSFASQSPGFTGALSRMAGETAGSYEITQGSLALADNGDFKATDYVIAFTSGVNFTIIGKSVLALTISDVGPFVYDGNAKTPQPVVYDGAVLLTNAVHYTLSYTNHVNAGTGSVIVAGLGNYSGVTNKNFTITPALPTVTTWPTAAPIMLSQALSNATLITNGVITSVPGSFSYVSPAIVPPAGVYSASVIFKPVSANYQNVTSNVLVTVVDPYKVPFWEPFEDRALTPSALNGQFGWNADGTVVQTNRVFAGAKAAQISGGGGYLKHAFSDGRTKVWTDLRVQVVQSPEKPTPEADATVAIYVWTNSVVWAFDGTNALSTGISVIPGTNVWNRFTTFSDYTTKKYILYVNDVRAGKYSFFNASVTNFTELKVSGEATFVDNVGITPNQPAMKYMPSLILLQ